MIASFLLFFSLTLTTVFANVFPGEIWDSGRIDIRDKGDKMFYILYKARNKNPKAPLLLYMAGGPGTSGEFNIFLENGPYITKYHPNIEEAKLEKNPYAWNNEYDLMYIDQPLGVGYSLNVSDSSICLNRTCVVENVYRLLMGFYKLHPEYKGRPLYISGVSYAGHYVPGVSADLIRRNNPDINFRGAIIGGPWIDSGIQLTYDSYYLYVNGKFSYLQYLYYTYMSLLCRIKISIQGNEAYDFCSKVNSNKDNATHISNDMNINETRDYEEEYAILREFWNRKDVQEELGVCCAHFYSTNSYIGRQLRRYDWLVPYEGEIAYILENNYPVTLMYGDLDYTCQYFGGLAAIESINWHGNKQFLNSKWEELGTHKRRHFEKLTVHLIKGAGHLIPKDQPELALKLLKEFITNNP